MTSGGNSGDDPWAAWKKGPVERRPDPARLKYSDSPYAPDWAKRPEDRAKAKTAAHPPDPATKPVTPAPDDLPPQRIADMPVTPAPAALGLREVAPIDEEDEHFRPDVDWFEAQLWHKASDDVRVYALMDGYWAKGLYGRLLASPDLSWAHMFQGDVALNNIQDAPFIIALKRGHKLLHWLVKEGWGKGWGSYFTASTNAALDRYGPTRWLPPDMAPSNEERVKLCSLTEGMADPLWLMRNHFRRFSDVEFEDDGRTVDFRYYDPVTLRTYLPNCNEAELKAFFGPVNFFLAEHCSRVKSLNRPEQAFLFRCRTEISKGENRIVRHLEAQLYDFAARKPLPFTLPPMPTEKAKRSTGLVMIRKGQLRAFEALKKTEFINGTADEIVKLGIAQKRLGLSEAQIRQTVHAAISTALGYNIETKSNLYAYSICAVMHGPEFFRQLPGLCKLIETPQRDNDARVQLKKMLQGMANMIVRGRKL